MKLLKNSLCWLLLPLFFILAGCATSMDVAPNELTRESVSPGVYLVYRPSVSTTPVSVSDAKKNIVALFKAVDRIKPIGIKYYDTKGPNQFASPNALYSYLRSLPRVYQYQYRKEIALLLNVVVDRISADEEKINVPLIPVYYSELIEPKIVLLETSDIVDYPYVIKLGSRVSLHFHENALRLAMKIVDNLSVIQEDLRKKEKEEFDAFAKQAEEYKNLPQKPAVSEEQRKLIVQANSLSSEKDYAGAVKLYEDALKVNPVSYPEAYFNMALLCAQEKRFYTAINYMKKYLLLEPEAKDARGAQDKIYEWELKSK
jgi:tetratricopeptide (TPR) repeat protein